MQQLSRFCLTVNPAVHPLATRVVDYMHALIKTTTNTTYKKALFRAERRRQVAAIVATRARARSLNSYHCERNMRGRATRVVGVANSMQHDSSPARHCRLAVDASPLASSRRRVLSVPHSINAHARACARQCSAHSRARVCRKSLATPLTVNTAAAAAENASARSLQQQQQKQLRRPFWLAEGENDENSDDEPQPSATEVSEPPPPPDSVDEAQAAEAVEEGAYELLELCHLALRPPHGSEHYKILKSAEAAPLLFLLMDAKLRSLIARIKKEHDDDAIDRAT